MPKQEFDLLDYTAPIGESFDQPSCIVGVLFAIGLFLSAFVINFTCIKKEDEITQFEKWGARRNIRLGPHRLSVVKKCMDKRYITDEDV